MSEWSRRAIYLGNFATILLWEFHAYNLSRSCGFRMLTQIQRLQSQHCCFPLLMFNCRLSLFLMLMKMVMTFMMTDQICMSFSSKWKYTKEIHVNYDWSESVITFCQRARPTYCWPGREREQNCHLFKTGPHAPNGHSSVCISALHTYQDQHGRHHAQTGQSDQEGEEGWWDSWSQQACRWSSWEQEQSCRMSQIWQIYLCKKVEKLG